MANKIIFELDRPRHLLFGLAAGVRIEKRFNMKLGDLGEFLKEPGMSDILGLLHCMLIDEDRDISENDLANLIDEHSSTEKAIKIVEEAISSSVKIPNE